jgi:signal transduction histidine kinase
MKKSASSGRRYRVRLAIGIPCLMLLMTAVYGQVCRAFVLHAAREAPLEARETLAALATELEYLIYGGGIVATLFGVVLAHVITRPLNEMARSFESLASGKRAPSLRINMGNEIGYLYQSFDRMVNSLERMLPERARYIFHNVASGILTVDADGILTNINSATDKILELGGVGIDRRKCGDFFTLFREMNSLVEVLRQAWEEGKTVQEKKIRIRTISGTQKTVAVTTVVSDSTSGEGFDVVATVMDVSRLESIAAKMQHEDKLSTVGRLASGIAHEIRNPLGSMRGMAQLLRENIGQDSQNERKYTDLIIREVDRLNAVVEQLLEFARPSPEERQSVQVDELIQNAVDLIRNRVKGRESRLGLDIDKSLPSCWVVPDKMTQVILNLLMNAVEAVPVGGTIRVSADRVAEGVRVSVFNSGSYIPPHERAHLFEPFFTTKERGTGLGLAVSYQIVAAHGGSLVAESDEKKGTTFHCILPVQENTDSQVAGKELVAT